MSSRAVPNKKKLFRLYLFRRYCKIFVRVGSILVLESFLLKKSLKKEKRGVSFLSRKKMRLAKNSKRKNLETGMLQKVNKLKLRKRLVKALFLAWFLCLKHHQT